MTLNFRENSKRFNIIYGDTCPDDACYDTCEKTRNQITQLHVLPQYADYQHLQQCNLPCNYQFANCIIAQAFVSVSAIVQLCNLILTFFAYREFMLIEPILTFDFNLSKFFG